MSAENIRVCFAAVVGDKLWQMKNSLFALFAYNNNEKYYHKLIVHEDMCAAFKLNNEHKAKSYRQEQQQRQQRQQRVMLIVIIIIVFSWHKNVPTFPH
jgi:hypothetical protein